MDLLTAKSLNYQIADMAVYAREDLESGDWDEKLDLINMHAQELRGMASELDLATYRRLEAKGRLVIVTARVNGKLIGYSSHVWYDDLHFSLRTADDDAWFVLPGYRGFGIGKRLREQAHRELRQLGVKYVLARLKTTHPHDTVIETLGYQPYEMIYRKEL